MKQFRLSGAGGARHARLRWLALLALCTLHVAQAQGALALAPAAGTPAAITQAARSAAPPKPPPEAELAVPSVTVEGERPGNRIDRQVYDIKADVSTSNGSAADALGNVPSVAVDPDGSVSLRGNNTVQILIDGKPSAMLQGENRGAALAATIAYSKRSNDQHGRDHDANHSATGELDSDVTRTSERSGSSESNSWGVRGEHKGDADGELFKMDLRVSSSSNRNDSAYAHRYAYDREGRQRAFSRQGSGTRNRVTDFTGDYERPVDAAMLKLGYKLARNAGSVDARYVNIDALTMDETDNAARSKRFELDETTAALYGSWQWRVDERWGVLGGLRAEYTQRDIRQLTARTAARNDYLSTIPSFFISYKASDQSTVRLSYAHRIVCPAAGDLNPWCTGMNSMSRRAIRDCCRRRPIRSSSASMPLWGRWRPTCARFCARNTT
ncbi:outer membrane beta-barrel protein [Massilia sp. CCM 8694]|uniref:Outer membrane beta-barrel protein n=1 Tax=Massilia genomosp. 1 TaxID=2609280 RepID=A0ABX0MMM5_9BURK|nr:TonB-dependent receptor [Massilia genomosp. 1]NHZ61160.1 outer membrane beta-barrel protein [Massilia genomosp. 1]